MGKGVGLGIGVNRTNYSRGIFASYASRVLADGGVTEAGGCVDAVSGLLLDASLLLIPSGYKSGKAYAEIPTNGNGDLTWTRASTALRTNSSGLLESMGSGVPRLSYMYGSCPALLLEPQRTNLALYSAQFDDATWVKDNSSVTANTTTSPDGTTNADTYTGNGSASIKFMYQSNTLVSGSTYSVSIYAKKNTNNFIQIFGANASFGINFWANFDLNNGVVGSVGSSATASITSVGNGWYRCTITGSAVASGTFASALFSIVTSSTSLRGESNTLSTSLFLWGAQLEAGAYPTTYIPTTTASATRVADSFSRNNIYTNGLITSSGGTWFVELRNNVVYTRDSSSRIGFGDTSNLQNTSFFLNPQFGGGRFLIFKSISNSLTQLFTTTTSTIKVAIKWNGSTADVFVNGTKEISATAFTTTNMEFLYADGVGVPTFVQAMALFSTPLTDTQCQTITTL